MADDDKNKPISRVPGLLRAGDRLQKSKMSLSEIEGALRDGVDIEFEVERLCTNVNQHSLGMLAADKQTLVFMRLMAREIKTLKLKVANQGDTIERMLKAA